MSGMVLQVLLRQVGVDSARMNLQTVGSTEFQTKFMVLSQSADSARALVTVAEESQMLRWPYVQNLLLLPSIVVDGTGVTARVRRDMSFGEMFSEQRLNYERELPERMLTLGVAAVNALRGSV